HDGPGALQAARAYRPHVVLLDIALGTEMGGYDVARVIRGDPDLQEALLICMTGYGRETDCRYAREAGFLYHFTKPANPLALQQVLEAQKKTLADPLPAFSRALASCWRPANGPPRLPGPPSPLAFAYRC